jgi:hypothetical protein
MGRKLPEGQMKSKLTSNLTNGVLVWAAVAALVAFDIAQGRILAMETNGRDRGLLSATNAEPAIGISPASSHHYVAPLTRDFLGKSVKNSYAVGAQQLIDDIVCEGRVTDGGWGRTTTPYPVSDALTPLSPGQVNFGGSASQDRQGHSAGQQEYYDHNQVDAFDFHSTIVTDVMCVDSPYVGKSAVIMGQGRVTKLNTFVDMIENFIIKIDDVGDPGRGQDMYQIQLNGTFMYDSGPILLQGGNVQVR